MKTEVLECYQNKRGGSYFELKAPDEKIIEVVFNGPFGYEVDEKVVDLYKEALTIIVDNYYKLKESPAYNNLNLQNYMCSNLLRNNFTSPIFVLYQNGYREEIGRKIKSIRVQKGMEAKKLAALIGIDAAHLSRIEQGKISVGIDTLGKIANVLGCIVDIVPSHKQFIDPFTEYREKRIGNEEIVIKHGKFLLED